MPKTLDFKSKSAKPFEIRSKSATKAEIIMYDQIGSDWFNEGITAKGVSDALKSLDPSVNEIIVRINSPGGDVFEGIAIYNRLKQFDAKITVMVDGLAASIASIIMLAGDEVIIGDGALVMIHLPWTMAMGNRNDIENTVQRLMDVEEQLLSIYAKRTGMDRSELRAMLEKETWMDSDQAIEMGFVTKKSDDESMPIAASMMGSRWMNKAPTNYKSEAKVVSSKLANMKSKIEATLARK